MKKQRQEPTEGKYFYRPSRLGFNFARFIIIFSIIAFCTFSLLIPFQALIRSRIDILKQDILTELKTRTGLEVSLERISPSWFFFLDIRNVKINPASDPESILTIGRVRIQYSLFSLIFMRPESILEELEMTNVSLNIRSGEFAKAWQKTISSFSLTGGGGTFKIKPVKISVRNLNCNYFGKTEQFNLNQAYLYLEKKKDVYSFDLKTKVTAYFNAEKYGLESIQSSLKIQGRSGLDLDYFDMTCRLESAVSDRFYLGDQWFNVILNKTALSITKIKDDLPVNLSALYTFNDKKLNFQAEFDHFNPLSLGSLRGDYRKYQIWLNAWLTGRIEAHWQTDRNQIAYTADFGAVFDSIPNGGADVSIKVDGTEQQAVFEHFDVSTLYGKLEYKGILNLLTMLPDGYLALSEIPLPSGRTASTAGSLFSDQGKIVRYESSATSIGQTKYPFFRLKAIRSGSSYLVSADLGQEKIQNFSLKAVYSGSLEGQLNMRDLDVSGIVTEFIPAQYNTPELINQTRGVSLSADLFFSGSDSGYSLLCPSLDLINQDGSKHLFATVAMTPEFWQVGKLELDWSGYSLDGMADFHHVSADRTDINVKTVLQGIPLVFSGQYSRQDGLLINGDYDFFLKASMPTAHTAEALLRVNKMPIALFGNVSYLTANMSGQFNKLEEWSVAVNDLTFQDLPFVGTEKNKFNTRLVFSQNTLLVQSISFEDDLSNLRGKGLFTYDTNSFLTSKGSLLLQDIARSQSVSLSTVWSPDDLTTFLTLKGFDISRGGIKGFSGLVDAAVNLTGPLENLSADVLVNIRKGMIKYIPFSLAFSAVVNPKQMKIRNFEAGYLKNNLKNVSGTIDLATFNASVSGSYSGWYFDKAANAIFSLNTIVTDEPKADFLTTLTTSRLRTTLSVTNLNVGAMAVDDWSFSMDTSMTGIEFNGGPGNSISGSYKDNTIQMSLASPLPVALRVSGLLTPKVIDVNIDGLRIDLIPWSTMVKGLDLKSGAVTGQFDLTGSIFDPEFSGELLLAGLEASYPIIEAPLKIASQFVILSGKNIFFPENDVYIGTSRVRTRGQIEVRAYEVSNFDFDVLADQDNTVPFNYGMKSFAAQGKCYGKVRMYGDVSLLTIEGDVNMPICALVMGLATESSGSGITSSMEVRMDMNITSGPRIEFYWPAKNLPLLRGTVADNETLNVLYDSRSSEFRLIGVLGIKNGQVSYLNRTFLMKNGKLEFTENTPAYDPFITLRAELREYNTLGNFKIYLIFEDVQVSRSNANPRFESDPPMSNDYILAMLGQMPFADNNQDGVDPLSLVALGGDLFTQLGILRPFEETVKDTLKLDVFTMRTQFVQNLLLDKLYQMDPASIDTSTDLGKYLENTSIILGKNITKDLYIEGMFSLESSNFDGSLPVYWYDLGLQTELSLEWETPFFTLESVVMPDFIEIDNTQINLSLSWKYIY